MMRRGFTLLELQVSLLLTLTTMAALFLFSFYFWQNYHQQTAMLQFHRQADVFFQWHHQKMRQCLELSESRDAITLIGLNGERDILQLGENGPTLGVVQFFDAPVTCETNYFLENNLRAVRLSVTHPTLNLTRTWECAYPVLPNMPLERW